MRNDDMSRFHNLLYRIIVLWNQRVSGATTYFKLTGKIDFGLILQEGWPSIIELLTENDFTI
jgi:hypothetical protein